MMCHCSHCGAENPAGRKVSGSCGASLGDRSFANPFAKTHRLGQRLRQDDAEQRRGRPGGEADDDRNREVVVDAQRQ